MKQYIERCLNGQSLTAEEAAAALDLIMTGQATDVQVAGLITAMRAKGETVEEVVGFARTMRNHSVHVRVNDPDAVDLCGTGGDGKGTFNISTVASFVVAGAGITVAKHGNRSVSSRSGSADVLAALGVNIQVPAEKVQDCINSIGIGFLFAPLFHPAMKYAGKARVELGVRTIFNMLGPLTNPAGVRRQLVGAFSIEAAAKVAGAFKQLSAKKTCIVHSDDGLDEISLSAATRAFESGEGEGIAEKTLTPESFGLATETTPSFVGGTAEENAALANRILAGENVKGRDIVLANAAAAIYVAGGAKDLREGMDHARESIDAGKALESLKKLRDFTHAA